MQDSILHNSSSTLIATFKFSNFFGIPSFCCILFMTCISSQTVLQRAFLTRISLPSGQCSVEVCQHLAKLRRRFVEVWRRLRSWPRLETGYTTFGYILCCFGPKLGQFLGSCSHHDALQKCTKKLNSVLNLKKIFYFLTWT